MYGKITHMKLGREHLISPPRRTLDFYTTTMFTIILAFKPIHDATKLRLPDAGPSIPHLQSPLQWNHLKISKLRLLTLHLSVTQSPNKLGGVTLESRTKYRWTKCRWTKCWSNLNRWKKCQPVLGQVGQNAGL